MKIKTQLVLSLLFFGAVMAALAVTTIATTIHLESVNNKKKAASDLAICTSEIGYMASDYLIYGEPQQLARLRSKFETLEGLVALLYAEKGELESLLMDAKENAGRMKSVLESISSIASRVVGKRLEPDVLRFRISWSRVAVQQHALLFDAARITSHLDIEEQELMNRRAILIYLILAVFGAFLGLSYFAVYRRIFDSIKKLRLGTLVIGSGNLDFLLDEKKNDEIGELSSAFNLMTRNLKNLTASKDQLESEIAERIQVEQYLAQARDNLAYDLYAMTALKELASLMVTKGEKQKIYDMILKTAEAIAGADKGHMLLFDENRNSHVIRALTGFGGEWIELWNEKSRSEGERKDSLADMYSVIVEDIMQSPKLAGTAELEICRSSGVRAFVSTPLISRAGKLAGVISTYFEKPHRPLERELSMLDLLASQAAELIERIKIETELEESEIKYKSLFNSMTEGFALHEIICNEHGVPRDYRFLELNGAFARLTGLANDIVGKTVKEAVPGIEQFWIDTYGKVALSGESVHFENYSAPLNRHYDVIAYRPRPMQFAVIFMDITERKRNEAEQTAAIDFLSLLNGASGTKELIKNVTNFFVERSGCEACGTRLKDGDDYPYAETYGFTQDFIASENFLCSRDSSGGVLFDAFGLPKIECMCGIVLAARFDVSKAFFTPHGSFWTNSTTELIASASEKDIKSSRNRCNAEGYESVTLIPIHSGEDRLGLVQLCDKRKNMFSEDLIRFWERLADYFAIALEKFFAEDGLADSEKRFATTLASIGDGVIATDVEGRIVFMNRVAEELTGFKVGDAGQRNVNEVFRVVNEMTLLDMENPIVSVLESGTAREFSNNALLTRKDGSRVNIDASCAPIRDREGAITGVVLVFRDITLRKKAEEVLRRDKEAIELLVAERTRELTEAQVALDRAKRLSDIGTLAATVAHELRNPLASMSLAAHNIKRKVKDPDIEKHTVTISKKVMESDQIINNLLYYSRIKPPHYTDVAIAGLVSECIETITEQAKKEASVEILLDPVKDLIIEADQNQLREIFSNILNNALDAVADSGGKICVSGDHNDTMVEISIRDNGCGIHDEDIVRVFDPFFTTKTRGTGLGLSVCRQIVTLHGGSIDIRSGAGKGTTVIVRLPEKRRG